MLCDALLSKRIDNQINTINFGLDFPAMLNAKEEEFAKSICAIKSPT